MGGAVFPPCSSMVGVMAVMATFFKRTYASMLQLPEMLHPVPLTIKTASAKDSWTLTGKSGSVSCGVTAPFSWVLVHTRFCLCPPRVLESCGSSVIKSHWPPKSNSLGVLSPFARSLGWEICCVP